MNRDDPMTGYVSVKGGHTLHINPSCGKLIRGGGKRNAQATVVERITLHRFDDRERYVVGWQTKEAQPHRDFFEPGRYWLCTYCTVEVWRGRGRAPKPRAQRLLRILARLSLEDRHEIVHALNWGTDADEECSAVSDSEYRELVEALR